MKKIFLSLAFVLPLTFISCEDPIDDDSNDDNNNDSTQVDGFWDVECYTDYDSVAVTSCDSVWIADSSVSIYELQCDSVLAYDSVQNSYWDVKCEQVLVNSNGQGGHYTLDCKTTYDVVLVQKCDSTWVEDEADSSSNGNNNGNQGYWDLQCDSVMQNGTWYSSACDSVWVN